jgi:hypothetical protein
MDHAMMIRADAKAMGAVTAHDTRVSKRWLPSSEAQRVQAGVGTSECVSYKLDAEGNKIDAYLFKPKRVSISNKRAQRRQANKAAQVRQHLLELVGNNSDVD